VEKRWIWPFELLDKLGEGGMGVVYRARYVVDNRHVAVKLLPPDVANETILSRFERELEILKTLRHPNIVRCFGGVCEGNQHFYAMELVEGGTLDRLLEERGRFPWEMVVPFALQMASGLAYAHERGVVHRDVKPGNFLLTTGGKLKLSDFGLATVVAATKITAAGKTMGTFPYMAPEQIRGRPPVSPQTDLYALGCVLFEMLTGRTPFLGDTPAEVMHRHLDEVPPRITEFAPDCPTALEGLVRDLLQKEPENRPESAYVVAQRLTDVVSVAEGGSNVKTRTETPPVASIPRGVPAAPRPAAEDAMPGGKWLVPLLGVLLFISVAWNIRSLALLAPSNPAEDLWIKAFQSGRPDLRGEAAQALGEIARDSPTAAQALTLALKDSNPTVRTAAIEGLTVAGGAARGASTELLRLQKSDENEQVRIKAGEALKTIQDSSEDEPGGSPIVFWIVVFALAGGIAGAMIWLRRHEARPGAG
jgi:serine/threonine-protein kinase